MLTQKCIRGCERCETHTWSRARAHRFAQTEDTKNDGNEKKRRKKRKKKKGKAEGE